MKKLVGIFGAIAVAGLTGCATEGYVRSQIEPLAERINRLEAKVPQAGSMSDADRAAVKQANDKAQQALDLSNRLADDARKVDEDAKKAESAAAKAEQAAKDAEAAARQAQRSEKKSEKIFKLEQKK